MKKILFISTNDWAPWGGSEVLWSDSALFICKTHINFNVWVGIKNWNPIPKHINNLRNSGAKIINKEQLNSSLISKLIFRLVSKILKLKYININHKIKINKWDLVVLSLGDHNEASELISYFRIKKIPYVMVVQLAKEANIIADGDNYNCIKNNYLEAKKVFFLSKQNLAILECQLASSLNNAEIISNPIPSISNTIKYPRIADQVSLAFVASLSSNHKGHDLLFQVLSSKKWMDRNIKVNLYGKGPHNEYIKNLAKFYKLKNIHFMGFENSLNNIWENNHALILCSRMEGQSLALIEAMYCGRVPIVTNVGGANELIEDGVNGFIAQSASLLEIDRALESAWQKRNEWEIMGELAAKRVREVFSGNPSEVFANKLVDLLDVN